MSTEPATSVVPASAIRSFAQEVADAIFYARDSAQSATPPRKFTKGDVIRIIAEMDAARTDKVTPPVKRSRAKKAPGEPAAPRPRNLLFDAFAVACGHRGKVNRVAAKTIAAALNAIKEVEPTVTPDQLTRATLATKRKFPDSGPMAVASHWHEFGGRARTAIAAPAPLPEPKGWREWVRENVTDPTHADRPWGYFDRATQLYWTEQINKAGAA
jgi:hypothetical protein